MNSIDEQILKHQDEYLREQLANIAKSLRDKADKIDRWLKYEKDTLRIAHDVNHELLWATPNLIGGLDTQMLELQKLRIKRQIECL